MKNLNYLMDIRHSRLFWIYVKKHGQKSDNSSVRKYVNKVENRITFEIKTGWKWWKCTSFRNYWRSMSTLQ